MNASRSSTYLTGLVRELCKLPSETEWVEFKVNEAEPREIGQYISALSNAAALSGKSFSTLGSSSPSTKPKSTASGSSCWRSLVPHGSPCSSRAWSSSVSDPTRRS
jgi:hypothetical protein